MRWQALAKTSRMDAVGAWLTRCHEPEPRQIGSLDCAACWYCWFADVGQARNALTLASFRGKSDD